MISTELSIVLGKQFHFLWCSILTLPEHYEKNGGSGKTGHCERRVPLKKVYPSLFFYPLRPFKLKEHEWLVNSKISTGPYYRAWTNVSKDKRKKMLSEVFTLWSNEMEDSVFIKTEDTIGKFCLWL